MACCKNGALLLYFLFFVFAFSAGRSILSKSKVNLIERRSTSLFGFPDQCPPAAFFFLPGEACQHECRQDDDCPGNQLCCDNGCKTCMEPVLPPAVIDWLGDDRGYTQSLDPNAVGKPLNLVEEVHVEEVSCYYNGVTLSKGQIFYKGCHRCQCTKEGTNCEVGPCREDDEYARVQAGLASGDEDEPSGENEYRVRAKVYARVEGEHGTRQLVRIVEAPSGESQEVPTDQEVDFQATSGYPIRREPEVPTDQEVDFHVTSGYPTRPMPTEQLTELNGQSKGPVERKEWRSNPEKPRGKNTVSPTAQQRIVHTAPSRSHRVERRRHGEHIRERVVHARDVDKSLPLRHVRRERRTRHR